MLTPLHTEPGQTKAFAARVFDYVRRVAGQFDAAESLLITHVLPTAIPYVNAVREAFPVRHVVAIPYSASRSAVQSLRSADLRVSTPSLDDIPRVAIETARSAARKGISLVIQEVGGYLAPHAAELRALGNVVGIVEDTAQGHWRYEQYLDAQVPVASIARSPLKALEDSLIGDAVLFTLERLMREELDEVPQGKRILVLGFGRIGRSCAIAARGREATTAVYDLNPVRALEARLEGFHAGKRGELLRWAEVIIGATGKMSLSASDFRYLKHGCILASASSRRLEFDMDRLSNFNNVSDTKEGLTRYTLSTNRDVLVANDGYPVNFLDRSILGGTLYLVYSQLLLAMIRVAQHRFGPGLHVLATEDEELLASLYIEELDGVALLTPETRFHLLRQLQHHNAIDEDELRSLNLMRRRAVEDPAALARSNPRGHFTGSAVIVSSDGQYVLLMRHKRLSRWLQFGGHAQLNETDGFSTALREASEESGLEGLTPLPVMGHLVDVDVHRIPADEREPEHEHLDLRYVLAASPEWEPLALEREVEEMKWFAWDELQGLALDSAMIRLMDKARRLSVAFAAENTPRS